MDDLSLRSDVLDELEFEPSIDAAHIGVAVDAGVVTLNGHVGSFAEKYTALRAVQRVKGVRAVANEIEVRFPDSKRMGDDEIARRALNVFEWDVAVPDRDVSVAVSSGWVTLTGEVQWQYQRQAAERDVRNLDGVAGVTNSITIKPSVQAYDVKQKIESALKRHAEVEAKAIRVLVGEGNRVTLEGEVDNWDERQAVKQAAWSAAGVREVVDHLTIGR